METVKWHTLLVSTRQPNFHTATYHFIGFMTRSRLMVTYLSGGVIENLTTHRMSKIEFQPDFRNPQMLSFLNMYNTMGSKMDGLAVRDHFLQVKN